MSVNRAQTIKPLLYLPAAEALPSAEMRKAVQGVIVEAGGDQLARLVAERASEQARAGCLFLARVGSDVGEDELRLLLAGRIDGVVLAACRGPADLQKLDVMLKVAEAEAGIAQGRTALLAEYATVPESVLSPHALSGVSPRLSALIFDASMLAEACGCKRVTATGDVPAVVRSGRAAVVLRAREAGIIAYEMLPADALDEAAVRRLWTSSLENGFSAMAVGSTEQIDLLAAAGVLPET